MDTVTETDFDWSPLGEPFWKEAAATVGATPLQAKFACCRQRGMTATGSARASGYSGDKVSIRQAGSRAAKSTAVMNMLSLARAQTGEGPDGVVTGAEAKRILSRLARGSDPNVRIKALESLARMDRDEREALAGKELSMDESASYATLVTVFGEDVAKLIDAHMKKIPKADHFKTKSISVEDYRKPENDGPEQPDAA